ncbi:MAG: choice-of-anchor E domain-containing protein, partial [Methanothrix sp.]|nr:choice-of-anchor E domain-containing protein [Methanothrix sp.]
MKCIKLSIILLILITIIAAPAIGEIRTQTYLHEIPQTSASWNLAHNIPAFDPLNGDLINVYIKDETHIYQKLTTINVGSSVVTFTASSAGDVNVTMPNGTIFNTHSYQSYGPYTSEPGHTDTFDLNEDGFNEILNYSNLNHFNKNVVGPIVALSASATCTGTVTGSGSGFMSGFDPYAASNLTVIYTYNATPVVRVVKTTNGKDANSPPGPYIPFGATVTWNYTLTNPGNVALKEVSVIDDKGVVPVYRSGDVWHFGWLDQNETWFYNATGSAVSGQYANNATVTAKSPEDVPVEGRDPSHYYGQTPS